MRAAGWVAVVVLVVAGSDRAAVAANAGTPAGPPASPLQATVADVAALSPSERAAFMKGYLSALTYFDVDNPACLVRWFYEKGGAAQVEKDLLALNTPGDPRGPSLESRKAAPMVGLLHEEAYSECGLACYGPVGPPTPTTPYRDCN